MNPETILYIVIAAVVSLGVVLFMYGYKSKYQGSMRWTFGILRFITLFSLLVLLINPSFTSETYTVEKPKLPVLVDNSASIAELNQTENLLSTLRSIQDNTALNEAFDISYYSFGRELKQLDSLTFEARNTNLSKALSTSNEIFKNNSAPTIVLTDGNQTLGTDYEFSSRNLKNAVFPVILGDSTTYTDLKIDQLNTNRYAFLKNQFPVEVILVYSGKESVTSTFVVSQGSAQVYRKSVSFSESNNTATLSFTLPATRVGLQRYTAQIVPLAEEKNTVNNGKRFAVEVIDQATNVLVVSDIIHPDLGALKKAITANEQRTFALLKPSEAISKLNDFQLIILYQPDRKFAGVYSEITKLKKNTLTFAGMQTDWNFLSTVQNQFEKEVNNQSENVSAILNQNYGTFAVEDIDFDDFPPLETQFGELSVLIPHETLLEQSIDGFASESPLLATMELNGKRDAIFDGEGLWKWRAHSFLLNDNFQDFDEFIAKMVQYLASSKRRSRLEVNSETFYYNNNQVTLSAQYFDKNYVFDPRASLEITVKNSETDERTVFPMLLKNNFFEVDLNSLPAGVYSHTVSVEDEAVSRSGSFTILDFNVEQQFGNANVTKLRKLATNTGGEAYFPSQQEELISLLINSDNYPSIQKSEQKIVPLIDWKYLLGLIVITLSAEWFIRKYNGLI